MTIIQDMSLDGNCIFMKEYIFKKVHWTFATKLQVTRSDTRRGLKKWTSFFISLLVKFQAELQTKAVHCLGKF